MNAIIADSATAITRGTGVIPNNREVSIPIGISIAPVALFDIKFVKISEIKPNKRSNTIDGATLFNENRAPLICPAAPEAIMASPNKRPPPTRKTNSH
jgi:hypothetical protein